MSAARPRPKSRRSTPAAPPVQPVVQHDSDEKCGQTAPGHMGGSFGQARSYAIGLGVFGFTETPS